MGVGLAAVSVADPPVPPTVSDLTIQPIRVLVVDDEENIRGFLNRMLRSAGYETAVVSNGPQALDLVGKLDGIDLLLTDMMMPGMNGDELAMRLRTIYPALKVLYLTGFRDRVFEFRPHLWTNESLLEKPCTIATLLTEVARITRR